MNNFTRLGIDPLVGAEIFEIVGIEAYQLDSPVHFKRVIDIVNYFKDVKNMRWQITKILDGKPTDDRIAVLWNWIQLQKEQEEIAKELKPDGDGYVTKEDLQKIKKEIEKEKKALQKKTKLTIAEKEAEVEALRQDFKNKMNIKNKQTNGTKKEIEKMKNALKRAEINFNKELSTIKQELNRERNMSSREKQNYQNELKKKDEILAKKEAKIAKIEKIKQEINQIETI